MARVTLSSDSHHANLENNISGEGLRNGARRVHGTTNPKGSWQPNGWNSPQAAANTLVLCANVLPVTSIGRCRHFPRFAGVR